jgi:hypothetical protein
MDLREEVDGAVRRRFGTVNGPRGRNGLDRQKRREDCVAWRRDPQGDEDVDAVGAGVVREGSDALDDRRPPERGYDTSGDPARCLSAGHGGVDGDVIAARHVRDAYLSGA